MMSTSVTKREQGEVKPMVQIAEATKNYAFVMELQAGMQTQYANWRRVVDKEADIAPTWVPVSYYEEKGVIEKLRFLPGMARGVWRGHLQVKAGLGDRKYDAILFNTHNPAVFYQKLLHEQRCYLMFDVTPRQYDTMADWYQQVADKPGRFADWKHEQVKKTFQAAEGLFVWSNWTAQSAIEDYGADPKRIHIVPPGVDTQLWHPDATQKPNDGVTRMLFTGGDFERKGGDLIVRWARETQRKNWEIHLVTRDPVEPTEGVHVHHGVGSNADELIRLAQKCDVFVLPTRADCFSIASLEAMAAGLPVLVGNVGGISDIIDEGETGFLVPPADYEAFRDRLETLLDMSVEKRQAMGQRARKVVEAKFEAQALVRRGLTLMAGRA